MSDARMVGSCQGFTAKQIQDAIPGAIRTGDMNLVESLLRMLAVADPHAAQDVWDTLKLSVAMTDLSR